MPARGQKPAAPAAAGRFVIESQREIPVAFRVDVVVLGGGTGAVAAAVAAAEGGASVFLAAPQFGLGEDMCATLRLALAEGQLPDSDLARQLFAAGSPATPLHVKKALDGALLSAGVNFLFGCYATDVLFDAGGRPAGIVMANRAGRQAVVAKVLIDATDRAGAAMLAGAKRRPWPAGVQKFRRIAYLPGQGEAAEIVDRELEIPMPDAGWASFALTEQEARDRTYSPKQLRASDVLFQVPPDPVYGFALAEAWADATTPSLAHFQPAGVERLYVLSASADIPRPAAEKLLRPAAMIRLGRQIGQAAAEQARTLPAPDGPHLPTGQVQACAAGDVREVLQGLRPTDSGMEHIPAGARAVPVLGRYDVVVVGGGTSGASAAIAAARRGAKVLVVEYQYALGGTSTVGLIGRPYHGRDVGFAKEVPFPDAEHNLEDKMEWFRRQVRQAGGDIWFGVLACGAFVDGCTVRGAVLATPHGRGVVLAKVVIDGTGSADLAAAAGAPCHGSADALDLAVQGAGLPRRPLRGDCVNSDYLLIDESDMVDVWCGLTGARLAMDETAFDVGSLLHTRERRRVVGDHVLRYLDQITGRTYGDSVVRSSSDYDVHGYPSSPFFALLPHTEETRKAKHPGIGGECYTPYRCLLPKGLEGLLVIGVGISMERDASAMIRMQRDLSNQGYAAGVAAAMAAAEDAPPRQIDVRSLQRHLVEIGNLPAEALKHGESHPLPVSAAVQAVRDMTGGDRETAARALAIVLSHHEAALPSLHEAYAAATGEAKLTYAKTLGMLGEKNVVATLIEALHRVEAWDEKILQGLMAEYAHLPTPVDALVLALGETGDRRALPAILRLLEMLDAETTLSHHRAVATALERLGEPAAAEPLARLLAKPGMRGHAMTKLEPLFNNPVEKRRRTGPLREIVLARALYRCGDRQGLGESILREYFRDLRGLFARHARAVLASRPRR